MTIVFYGIALFFFLLLVGFAGKVIIGGLLGAKPEMFGFTRSGINLQQYLVKKTMFQYKFLKSVLQDLVLRTSPNKCRLIPQYFIFLVVLGLSKSLLAGALSISILSLPLITTTTEDAIKGLPEGYYHGSMGLLFYSPNTTKKIKYPNKPTTILGKEDNVSIQVLKNNNYRRCDKRFA